MTTFVTLLRRARTLLWTALSIVIIFSAVVVGLGKLLMPYSAQYKPRLEAWLSSEFGRPVELQSFTGEWRAFGPQLAVKGLRLPAGDGGSSAAVIEEAVIDIRPLNVLIPSRALYEFRIVGADFHLVHLADGTFEFSGLGVRRGDGRSESGLKQLEPINEVILQDSSLRYDDEVHDIHLDLKAINGRLQMRGDLLAAEIGFRLAHDAGSRVSGELEAITRLRLDRERRPLSASWQLSAQELMLEQLHDRLPANDFFPERGRFNAEMWGDWDRENQHRIRGVVDLRDARLVNDHFDRSVERINTRFQWRFRELDDWRLDLAGFTFEQENSAWSVETIGLGRNLGVGVGLWVSADTVPVTTSAAIARDIVRMSGKDWPRYIPGAGEGVVRDFEMILNENMKLGTAYGIIEKGSVSEWDIWPDISNVDGRLEFGPGRHGSLILNGRDVIVEWPRMFDAPLTVDMPSCRVDFTWGPEKGKYQVALPDCRVESPFVSARGRMLFRSNEGKPAVDVMVHADRLDASVAGPYWPRDLLKDRVVAWLENGLVQGRLESGKLQIHGDMDHWPFDGGEGRFEATANVTQAEIAYFEGWPRATGVDGTAHFVNSSMDVSGRVADIGGIPAQQVRVRIGDFRDAGLRVDYESESNLSGLLGFLKQSPISERIGTDLGRFEFVGPATTAGTLTVPLGQGEKEIDLAGSLQLEQNAFLAGELDFALTGINGSVEYHQSGFEGENIEAQYLGKPARLAIEAGEKGAADGEGPATEVETARFTARLIGNFDVADVIPGQIVDTWSPLSRIRGNTEWHATLETGGLGGDGPTAAVRLTSRLEGVTIGLPPPLDKPAVAAWPLELNVPLEGDRRILRLSLDDRLNVKMALGDGWTDPLGAAVQFGPGEAELPAGSLLSISGVAESVDLDGWIGLVIDQARQGKDLGGLELESGRLSADEMRLVDRRFEDVEVRFSAGDGVLNANFDADAIDGDVTFVGTEGGSQSLSAEFERLVLGEPLTTGMEMDVDPALLPALHLYAKSFRYGEVELGETRIEAYPTRESFHFEKVEAESPHMSVNASGDWSIQDGVHRSNFEIHMASESLGDFLRQLDIASPMEGGQTLVDFNVWWDGSPGQFRLARLNGDVNFSVNTGVISNASPGTGRLLGLLSVQSLPRRLALDFRDVFDAGFAFDEANGSFTMLNGSARTDDVTLTSSAANISFSGTTDLVAREYDQLITVRPGLGNTLPVIGAIAGGPGGAAAGLALQGLLHDELGEASQVQYTLTGAWDEPQIEPVLKGRADG